MPGWRRKLLKRVFSAKPVMYGGQLPLSDLLFLFKDCNLYIFKDLNIYRLQLAFKESLFSSFITVLAFR